MHAPTLMHPCIMHPCIPIDSCASTSQVREVHITHTNPQRRIPVGTAEPVHMPYAGRQPPARVASAHEMRQSTDVDCIVKATGVAPSYARCVCVRARARACVGARACVRVCKCTHIHAHVNRQVLEETYLDPVEAILKIKRLTHGPPR